jgi:transposase
MLETTCCPPDEQPMKRGRVPLDPTPRFKPDDARALGAAEAQVPQEHMARQVQKLLEKVDTAQVESRYSALGQHGYRPKRLLILWVYASLMGLHHATKLARALQTDAALRLLSGGHAVSRPVLNRFRKDNAQLFTAALQTTVKWAYEEGLVDERALAVDSVRLRAHASSKQVRTLKRSSQRLQQLAEVDTAALCEQQRARHEQKVHKHTEVVEKCTQAKVASMVLTSPAAGLMQFPASVALPGHRVTVTASGVRSRLVVGVLINAAPNDMGLLEDAVRQARGVLVQAGLPRQALLQVAGDAGYWSEKDLAFAAANSGWVDVLLDEKPETGPLRGEGKNYFGRDDFNLVSQDEVLCPAGRRMTGPRKDKVNGCLVYFGDGCADCPKRKTCTPAQRRTLSVKWEYEKLRALMRQRMAQEGALERYHQRMPTVEPVFSSLEDCMGFRRVSSRHPQTVTAEILLKLLAHNVSRLLTRRRLLCVYFLLPVSPAGDEPPAQF